MKKYILYSLLTALVLAVSTGCRTAHGFGQDMEKAGEKIQDKTDK